MTRRDSCREDQILNLLDYPRITVILSKNRWFSPFFIYHCIMHYATNPLSILALMKHWLSIVKSFLIFN